MIVHKLLLKGAADDLVQLERFSQRLAPHEYERGARLRTLAVELAKRAELEVSAVAYKDESLELEVILASDRFREPVRIDRDKTGDHCQVSWEWWTEIKDDPGIGNAAQMVVAVLASCAANR
jgi:hypothetical protein